MTRDDTSSAALVLVALLVGTLVLQVIIEWVGA